MIHIPPQHQVDPDKAPGQIKTLSYLETINHPQFRKASLCVWHARQYLAQMGMSHAEAYGWIQAWASGAGDGTE